MKLNKLRWLFVSAHKHVGLPDAAHYLLLLLNGLSLLINIIGSLPYLKQNLAVAHPCSYHNKQKLISQSHCSDNSKHNQVCPCHRSDKL